MKKLLYIHPYNNYTGSTKVLSDVLKANYLDLAEITVITDTSQDGFLSGLGVKLINVPIIRYKNRAVPIISAIVWVLIGFFKTLYHIRKVEGVYINTILPGFAAIAARICGKKVIYHVHEIYVKKNPKSWFGEFVFNHVKSHRIYVSNYLKEQYKSKVGCTSEVVYNKLGDDFFSRVELVPVEQHKRNHVLMLATLQRGKGLEVFVNVARLMPNYQFSLVISSPQGDIDRLFNVEYPVNLKIFPKQADVHPFYKRADIIVNLSDPKYIIETFGLTIIEGMAYGLPAICPNIGGPKEVVEDGVTGYAIDVSNPACVVEYIKKCTEEKEYRHLYNNSLKRVVNFTLVKKYE